MSDTPNRDKNGNIPHSSEIAVRYGNLEFSGKGEQEWLAMQFKAFLNAMPQNLEVAAEQEKSESTSVSTSETPHIKFSTSLALHIKNKGAAGNQTKRFLVTADWIRLRGKPTMSTSDVAKALTENHQSRLANPADCLNKNVAKGFCEKSSGGFYITPEGLEELGYHDG